MSYSHNGLASVPRARLSGILESLSHEEARRLAPYVHQAEVRQGQVLVEGGEPIEDVWFPQTCVTSTVVTMPEGRTIEVGLAGLEGLVGLSLLFGSRTSNATVVCQIPGLALCVRAIDFIEHVVRPRGEAFEALLRYCDMFMSMVAQTAACNSLHPIDQRLARWILMTHDRVRRDDMPLTQEFIAYMLGVRRASVSVAAAALQVNGLIRYSRGRIIITDRAGLERQSCPCYQVVRSAGESLGITPAA